MGSNLKVSREPGLTRAEEGKKKCIPIFASRKNWKGNRLELREKTGKNVARGKGGVLSPPISGDASENKKKRGDQTYQDRILILV